MTDSEIVCKMVSEPEEGFRMLFDEYHNYAYTIVYNILRNMGDSRDIEECVTDVMSDVMISYDSSRNGSLKAYIGTAAKNRALDMSRIKSRNASRLIPLDAEQSAAISSDENVEKKVENSELARIIMKKIEEIGPPDSELLIQKYFFDRNSVQIAKVLQMNPVTVRSRCSRAVKRLKQILSGMDITL